MGRFERMSESLPPLPHVARQLDDLRANLRKAGVPEHLWRYDLPEDPRLAGIKAYNRSVNYWNSLSPDEQKRIGMIGKRR